MHYSRGVGVLSHSERIPFELSLTHDLSKLELVRNVTRVHARGDENSLIDMCVVPRHIISTCRELDLARSPSSIVVEISKDDILVSVVRKKDISNESVYLSKEVFIFCDGWAFLFNPTLTDEIMRDATPSSTKRYKTLWQAASISWTSYLRCTIRTNDLDRVDC